MSHEASDCRDFWNNPATLINCHYMGDLGADFYLSGRGGLGFLKHTWSLPVTDMANIYANMGLSITSAEIVACNTIFFVGSILEEFFGSYLTFVLDLHSAFLTEDLDGWYNGGIEDMVANVMLRWDELATTIDKSLPITHLVSGSP